MIRRRYIEGRYGQVHLRENARTAGNPLACLHATAYSSRSFGAVLAALDGRRYAIAVDTPGYGESDPPPSRIAIADYAEALADILPERFDLFGYHTGVAIAVEIAIRHPARVGQLILMGIPHFHALDFAAWRAKLASRHVLSGDLSQFAERWDFLVVNRPERLSLARGFDNFLDELKAWPNGWWAHDALFDYDLEAKLPLLRQPVTVLNPEGHLSEPSRIAAGFIRDARVIELPNLNGAVLDSHAAAIADALMQAEVPA